MAGMMKPEENPERVDDSDLEEPNVAEDEQGAYEAFVTAGMEMLYAGGEVKPEILKLLDEDPSDLREVIGNLEFTPELALSATAVIVVLQLVRSADPKPEGDLILHGGKELFEQIAHISDIQREAAGQPPLSDEEFNKAWFKAMDLYREAAKAEGLVDEEALKADFEQIKAADAAGAFAGEGENVDAG